MQKNVNHPKKQQQTTSVVLSAALISTYFTIQYVIRCQYTCVLVFYINVLVKTFVGISPFHSTDCDAPVPPVQARASCSSASSSDEY